VQLYDRNRCLVAREVALQVCREALEFGLGQHRQDRPVAALALDELVKIDGDDNETLDCAHDLREITDRWARVYYPSRVVLLVSEPARSGRARTGRTAVGGVRELQVFQNPAELTPDT
jgi:hypothetical protein